MKKRLLKISSTLIAAILFIATLGVAAEAIEVYDPAMLAFDTADIQVQSPIVEEDISKREENIKYFKHEDGSITAVTYGGPVHYKKEGLWLDIDNTLVQSATRAGKTFFTNKANSLQVELPVQLEKDSAISVTRDGYRLSWKAETQAAEKSAVLSKLPIKEETSLTTEARLDEAVQAAKRNGALEAKKKKLSSSRTAARIAVEEQYARIAVENEDRMTPKALDSAVVYKGALNSKTDLRYDLSGGTLKESIVLQSLPQERSYSFLMRADGMEASLQNDGSVVFAAEGQPIFVMASPYLIDANGDTCVNVSVALEEADGQWRYTLTPDRTWLEDEDRAWPVVLDPSVNADTSYITDTYVSSSNENSLDNQNKSNLQFGRNPTNGIQYQSYLKFINLPDIPENSLIVDASLTMKLRCV